tara:strand:+ start:14493 stop:15722 length:1230 start_codon:yes stop_codon:yes gene_type:complete
MTVSEMHIAVNQGVQKIASHQVDVLLPQEIDFELNKAQDKFVKGRYNQFGNKYSKGFEQSQKRIDDLRRLITEESITTTYKGQVDHNVFIDSIVLPEDNKYMFLLNQRSLVYHNNCQKMDCIIPAMQPLQWAMVDLYEFSWDNYSMVGYNPNDTYWVNKILIEVYDENGVPQQIDVYNQAMGGITGGCTDNSVYTDNQYLNNSGVTTFINLDPTGSVPAWSPPSGNPVVGIVLPPYWTFRDDGTATIFTNPDCFIVVERWRCNTNSAVSDRDGVRSDGVPRIDSQPEVLSRSCDDVKYTTSSVNRFSQLDDIYTLLDDPFNKTKHTSPLSTINGSNLDIYTDETFFVPKVKLTYLRKPRAISSTTGSVITCELAEHTHQEIVDMSVASILEGLADPRYQTNRMEELRSE